jgi:hypothetical protein
MKPMSCTHARLRLAAYRDSELGVDDQIAIRAHLGTCVECGAELESLEHLGAMLRHASHARIDASADNVTSLHNRAVAAIDAQRAVRLSRRVDQWFDDLHIVWAAAGATVATLACLVAGSGVARLTLREIPSSMSAVIGAMADPGSDRNPLPLDSRVLVPTLHREPEMPAVVLSRDEGVLALSAVVTREGRVSNVEFLASGAGRLPHERAVLRLLDAAAQTRFEPARAGGAPVAVNVVWLLAHTTVIGKDGLETVTPAPPARRMQVAPPIRPAVTPSAPISQSPALDSPVAIA